MNKQQNVQQKQRLQLKLNLNQIPKINLYLNNNLPINQYQKELAKNLSSKQIIIINASTGSGKSTQIPQILYKYYFKEDLKIIVTQPRRICCISLQQRVQYELNQYKDQNIKNTDIGYAVRFEQLNRYDSKILYCTEGFLVQDILSQGDYLNYLNNIDFLIIDEAHEQTVNQEILFGCYFNALKKDKNLKCKLIICSASLQNDNLIKYFSFVPIIQMQIPGKQFPVIVHYAQEDKIINYLQYSIELVKKLIQNDQTKSILVFFPGIEDINFFVDELQQFIFYKQYDIEVFPLHAQLTIQQQERIFVNKCKIIASTNIAETSLTIPDVNIVIDSGQIKQLFYDSNTHSNKLVQTKISKSNFIQRKGRVGRCEEGIMYCCYSENDLQNFDDNQLPEIKRIRINEIILKIIQLEQQQKVVSMNKIFEYNFLNKISQNEIRQCIQQLCRRQILIQQHQNVILTQLGIEISQYPLDYELGLLILSMTKINLQQVIYIIYIVVFITEGIQIQKIEQIIDNDWINIIYHMQKYQNYNQRIKQSIQQLCNIIGIQIQCNEQPNINQIIIIQLLIRLKLIHIISYRINNQNKSYMQINLVLFMISYFLNQEIIYDDKLQNQYLRVLEYNQIYEQPYVKLVNFSLFQISQHKQEGDISLNSLGSPPVNCPSPNVIFTSGGNNKIISAVYHTPLAIKTPSPNKQDQIQEYLNTAYDELVSCIQQIKEKFVEFEQKVNSNDQQQENRVNDEGSTGVNHLLISDIDMFNTSIQSPSSIKPTSIQQTTKNEYDTIISSQQDNSKIIQQMVDSSIEENIQIMKQEQSVRMNNELALRRLESDIQTIIKSQYQLFK